MMLPVTELNACTEEELQQVLAAFLTHAREESLNDAEVQEFWQVYEEIQRRCSRSGDCRVVGFSQSC